MSTSNSHQTISKEAMLAGFPSAVPAITGEISPMELLRLFRHLIECAQSTTTAYHELNFLFLVVPPSVWPVYSNGPRPTPPQRPGTNPAYVQGNAIQNQMIKDNWAVCKKYYEEDQNMNKALTERFLDLVPAAQRQGYKDILIGDPNRRFEDTFAYFYDNYGQEDEIEIENNKDKMKADWHPRDGFEVLKQRIKDGMMYAAFSNKPISSDDALNMMMVVITRTRLFSTQYQEWHAKQPQEKTLMHAFEFWGLKVRLLKKYDRVAGTMGRGEEYGMAASDDDEDKATAEVVEDYALSMQLSNQNAMLQQQLQQ